MSDSQKPTPKTVADLHAAIKRGEAEVPRIEAKLNDGEED